MQPRTKRAGAPRKDTPDRSINSVLLGAGGPLLALRAPICNRSLSSYTLALAFYSNDQRS